MLQSHGSDLPPPPKEGRGIQLNSLAETDISKQDLLLGGILCLLS